jgi:ribonuclease VapC
VFVDTSAIIAILASETDAEIYIAKLEAVSAAKVTGAHVLLEAAMRLSTLLDISPIIADASVMRLLREAQIDVAPITEEVAHLAVSAFERYGKGRGHPAQLNFGDCLSYACAQANNVAILFKGNDFAQTDIEVA